MCTVKILRNVHIFQADNTFWAEADIRVDEEARLEKVLEVDAECTWLDASSEAAGRMFDKLELGRVSDIEGADEKLREEMMGFLVETLLNIDLWRSRADGSHNRA